MIAMQRKKDNYGYICDKKREIDQRTNAGTGGCGFDQTSI